MRSFWLYSFWNLLNKIFSFFRVQIQIIFLGDTVLSDVFFVAQKVIALIRRIFVDGSFDSLLISYYQDYKKDNQHKQFAGSVFFIITAILLITVIVVTLSSGIIAKLLGINDSRVYLFKKFVAYLSPLIIFMFLMSFFTSILNTNEKFQFAAPAPVFGNIFYIGSIVIFGYFFKDIVSGLIIGSLLYSIMQVVFMVPFANSYVDYRHKITIDKPFLKKTLASSSIQIVIPLSDLIIQRLMISLPVGNISYLEYGHKILQFVFSIIVVALSNVSLPVFSSLQHNQILFKKYTKQIFLLSHFIIGHITVFILYFGTNISYLLFGNLKRMQNPMALGQTISIMGFSLYFLVQARVLSNILLSKKHVKYNNVASIILAAASILFTVILLKHTYIGVSWAFNISSAFYFIYLLGINLYKKYITFSLKEVLYMMNTLFFAVFSMKLIFFFSNLIISKIFIVSKVLKLFIILFLFSITYIINILIHWKYTQFLFKKTV